MVGTKPFLSVAHLCSWAVRSADVTITQSKYAPATMPHIDRLLATEVVAVMDQLDVLDRLAIWVAFAGRIADRKALARAMPSQRPRRGTGIMPLDLREAIIDEWIGAATVRTRRWDARCGSHMRVFRSKLWAMGQLDDVLQRAMCAVQSQFEHVIQHQLRLPTGVIALQGVTDQGSLPVAS